MFLLEFAWILLPVRQAKSTSLRKGFKGMLKIREDFNFSEQLGVDKFVNGIDVNGVVLLVMTESPSPQKTTFPFIIFSIFSGTLMVLSVRSLKAF